MKYMGSKNRIAKFILPIMLESANKKGITTWVEPFVGGGNMIDKVPNTFTRIGIDYNPHTIAALIAIRDFVDKLPNSLTEQEYKNLKGKAPEPITSWLRFVASFGGKFDNGYAREKRSNDSTFIGRAKRNAQKQSLNLQGVQFLHGSYDDIYTRCESRNYVDESKRNAQKQSPNLQGVQLLQGSYDEYSYFENCLIYCDPPYEGTTSYKTDTFDHKKFWQWCRDMSKNNLVFVSEYKAPDDFICVWQGEVKTNFASQRKKATHIAVEKLFTFVPTLNK